MPHSGKTHRALFLASTSSPLALTEVPTPTPSSGQVLVRSLASPVVSYSQDVMNGKSGIPLNTPIVPGTSTIGRIISIGEGATTLKPGQLVYVDATVRSRDSPRTSILQGWLSPQTPEALKLKSVWRDGGWADVILCPIESVEPLDEIENLRKYEAKDLTWMTAHLIPFGGLSAAKTKAGDTVIVAPATGYFGAAGVRSAVAMGASRIVVCGRNKEALSALESHSPGKVKAVVITGDVDADAAAVRAATIGGQGADVYLDMSPAAAAESTHIRSCIRALKSGGRCVLGGGILGDIRLPYVELVINDISVIGKFMFEREDRERMVRMIVAGQLSFDGLETAAYGLDQVDKAMEDAKTAPGWKKHVVLVGE